MTSKKLISNMMKV